MDRMPLIRVLITSTCGLVCVTYTNQRLRVGDECVAIYYDEKDIPITVSVVIAQINEVEIKE